VFNRFISITTIIFMLVAQAGEAFAVSSMPCFGNESSMSMMMSDLDESDSEAMMDHECCQQECDCPVALLSLAVLIELNVQTIQRNAHTQQIDVNSRLLHTFIPQHKRPPISLFNLAA
jgi:hypothetical protein